MPLRTSSSIAICLQPPGNVARELVLYKRRLFSELGCASALAFPEIALIASGRTFDTAEGKARNRREIHTAMTSAWAGLQGSFTSGDLVLQKGIYYLRLEAPFSELTVRLGEALSGPSALPLTCGAGFYLCAAADVDAAGDDGSAGEGRGLDIKPPPLSFYAASLSLYRFYLSAPSTDQALDACAWRELDRVPRHRGKPPVGSL